MAATEMFWQGSGLVDSIDAPFAANYSPKVAPARLSTQSLITTVRPPSTHPAADATIAATPNV